MDEVLRALVIYGFLMVIFRLSGKRSLAEMTPFDLVLILIFSEVLQSALLGRDESLTAAMVVILTLVSIDIAISLLKQKSPRFDLFTEGVPIKIMENGKLLHDRMQRSRIDEADILAAARQTQGIEELDKIKTAVLERSGTISIIPKESGG